MKTIDCALAQDLMPLYTEGMLSPESREALEEHLAGCEACRRTAGPTPPCRCSAAWPRGFTSPWSSSSPATTIRPPCCTGRWT